MRSSRKNEIKEIRINDTYTSLLGVEEAFDEVSQESTPIKRNRILRTQNYINKLTADVLTPATIAPPNCRYLERFNEGYIVVVEQPPAVRTIAIDLPMGGYLDTLKQQGKLEEYGYKDFKRDNQRPYMFTLAFPYTIFTFSIDNNNQILEGRIACRTRQISGMSDMLFKVPINNISDGDSVCWPNDFYRKRASVYSATMLGIKAFWSSIFNSDYSYNPNAYREDPKCFGLQTYLEWQYMTQENPLFIYNVKWLRLGKLQKTIGDMINHYNFTSLSTLNFKKLQKLFKLKTPSGISIKPHPRARKLKTLYYDICQSAFFSANILVNVGDKFKYSRRRKRYGHVESFLGIMGAEPSYIQVDVEGRPIKMKLTKKVKKYIAWRVNSYRRQTKAIVGDIEIKKNDILVFKNVNDVDVHKKVEYIQKTVDGQLEIKAGEFYLVENLKDVRKFDTSKPKINGINLEAGKEYVVLHDGFSPSMIQRACIAKFTHVGADRNGIYFGFEWEMRNFSVRPSSEKIRYVYEKDELKPLRDRVFFLGRKIFVTNNYSTTKPEVDAWISPYGIILERNTGVNYPNWSQIKSIVNEDTFHIRSFNLELTFKVGDLVVISDWKTPLNMLMVRKIIGIKTDDVEGTISFDLEDKHGNIINHIFVDYDNGLINLGTMRKVTTEIGKLKAGTKIIPKVNNIPGFPEDSINIIIAFITDTGCDEPLVLCSNCQTLWLNDLINNFTKVKMTSKRWETLNHENFDIDNIEVQHGDLVNGSVDHYDKYGLLIATDPHKVSRSLIHAFKMCTVDTYIETLYMDRYLKDEIVFDSILNPRISVNSEEKIYGVPNFHGLIFRVPYSTSDMRFPTEYGRIIDV